jgi:hypothetical protein
MKPRTTTDSIVHTLIAGELFKFYLNELRANNVLTKKTKFHANGFLEEFKKAEGILDNMFEISEIEAVNVSRVFEQYVETIAKPSISDFENIIAIFEAYEKDPKSINGICKKILK